MNPSDNLKQIVEAALLASGKAMTLDKILELFDEMEQPEKKDLRAVLQELSEDYADRGIEIKEVASGWRIQVSRECAPWVSRLWEEKPGRYSRALMETLALIAYRQPITRGEIEDIRGVSVSTHIMRTLLEREWVRVVGQRDVPGKPSLYGTTREFLDYFGLKSLDELPTLAEIRDLDVINEELNLQEPDGGAVEQTTDEQKASDQEEMPAPDTSETTGEENSREEHALEPEPETETETETEPGTMTAADMDTDEKQT
ncbi:MAG TPA: SMC-Scp complex subunit ScpB [Thiolapillus brandeum]|uniref:SMC-Scp complex subunit ScpB n=1 Tax=Thiolapillus brandeum TaxID=1076588 RepID=A0A831RWC4_9GAMM|nr:SMC-Scp complex subunit ScpB [Thiolapillus brandeum]